MPFDAVLKDHADLLLKDLYNFREKLLRELTRSSGNIEEQFNDKIVTKLAEVQGCIQATREYLGK